MKQATVGMTMLYYPHEADPMLTEFQIGDEAHAAIVCYVHTGVTAPAGSVNLAVFDRNGVVHSYTAVPVIQDSDDAPSDGGFTSFSWRKPTSAPAPAPTDPIGQDSGTASVGAASGADSPAAAPSAAP